MLEIEKYLLKNPSFNHFTSPLLLTFPTIVNPYGFTPEMMKYANLRGPYPPTT